MLIQNILEENERGEVIVYVGKEKNAVPINKNYGLCQLEPDSSNQPKIPARFLYPLPFASNDKTKAGIASFSGEFIVDPLTGYVRLSPDRNHAPKTVLTVTPDKKGKVVLFDLPSRPIFVNNDQTDVTSISFQTIDPIKNNPITLLFSSPPSSKFDVFLKKNKMDVRIHRFDQYSIELTYFEDIKQWIQT